MRINQHASLAGSGLSRTNTALPPRHRGRPPKPEGAKTAAQRKAAQRERERLEHEAVERTQRWDDLKEKISQAHDKDAILVELARIVDPSDTEKLKFIQEQNARIRNTNDQHGRSPRECLESSDTLEKIIHAKHRENQVVIDPAILGRNTGYAVTEAPDGFITSVDSGRRVTPTGAGSYTNHEGFAPSEWIERVGNVYRTNGWGADWREGQESHPLDRHKGFEHGSTQKNVLYKECFDEFIRDHFTLIFCSPYPFEDRIIATLACDLPMDSKTRKECGAPKNASCLFASTADVLDVDEDPDFDLRIPGELMKDAVQHILAFHKKEFQRTLPAWMSRSRQYQLKKKSKLDVPCSKESHEAMRLKAVARNDNEALACPRCKTTVYLPPEAPRITAERDKSERPKRDPVPEKGLVPWLANKVLNQQGSPDLDK